MSLKKCSMCNIEKQLNDFRKIKENKYRSNCKSCEYEKLKIWRKNNPDKQSAISKRYYDNNKEKVKNINQNYYTLNKDDVLHKRKKWKTDNSDRVKLVNKIYNINNKNIINKKKNIKYKEDEQYNLSVKIRKRIYSKLKNQETSKRYRTIKLLGCNFEFYKKYVESLFIDGMTWELLRQGKIHIDHIKPLSSFDLTKPEEQKKAFHYSNTQPLWAEDNLRKGAKTA